MNVTLSYPKADEILEQYRSIIADDFQGYRNHVTRMLNFCHYLHPDISEQDSLKFQIAAAFHDIALWTHDRVDYLDPSVGDCMQYLEQNDLTDWKDEITVIIDMHHYIKPYKGEFEFMTEIFRKGDLVDFSLGMIKFGIPADFVKAVKQAIPNAGFHKALMRFTGIQFTRTPWNPLPMMRYRNKYKGNNEQAS